MARKVKSAQQITQAWLGAMADPRTRQKYSEGINNTTVNPMAEAAAKANEYQMGVARAVADGRWQARLLATPKQRWQQNATSKSDRLTSGAQAASDKRAAADQKWAPIYQQVSDTVASMPSGGFANAAARSAKAIEMMMSAAGKM